MSEILSIGELLDLGGSASTAGLIPYSALEYSAQKITAISGTAIGGQGGTDSATVSAIASAYVESAASGKLDNSASGLWYPLTGNPSGFLTGVDLSPYAYASSVSSKVDQSAFDNCCSSMSSVVSSLETSVTSMSSVVSGLTGDYLEKSASSMFQPSGDYQTAGDYAYNSSVSSKLDASASSQFAPSGDYADKSALSSYVPVSASGQFAPSGDYAYNSALSSKLDVSASSQFQPSGDYQTAGDYAYNSAVSGKLDSSAFTSYSSTVNNNITSIENNISSISSIVSGKADASSVHTYTGIDPIVVDNENDQISLSATAVHLDSSMTAYTSGGSGFIGVNGSITSQMTAFVTTADMSGYIPTSESSKYYSTSNPSSFATTAQVSAKLDASASSGFYSTSNPSGFLTSSYTPAFGYKDGKISSIDGSAVVGGFAYTSPSATIDIDNVNGTLEATRYAIRQMPAVNWTSNVAPNSTTAYIDYAASTLYARSATLTFTDISGATQLKVSALSSLDSAAYHYIGDGPTLIIPSAARDLLFVSGNIFGWSAKVTISAPAEPDRVEPLLYSSDRIIESIGMAKGGAPYITSLNKWAISASVAGSVHHADEADYATNANSSTSAMSAHKAVSAQAALKYFTGASSSDTAFISSLRDTYGYADSKITAINGSALAANMYTSPSGTIAVDNVNSTLESWNSSLRVDEHVTAASSMSGTARQVSDQGYFTLWTGSTLPGDTLSLSAYYTNNLSMMSASAFGVKAGGGTSKIAEFLINSTSSGSAAFSIEDTYSSISMRISSQNWVPQTGQYQNSVSGMAVIDRAARTASSTSVYKQVLDDSIWQSLTAWAASQGWTP